MLPEFIKRWPSPSTFIRSNRVEVMEVCRSLGFAERRGENMMKMTHTYLAAPWQHASELHGIGEYGARAWEIFCQGIIGDEAPSDHALVDYWRWYKQHQAV